MASSRGEVVTLQLGHYAGFVGAHWWNGQSAAFNSDPRLSIAAQEVNSDVLFREGITLQGEPTYTPRLVLMDLKGNLSSLRQQGVLYEQPEQDTSTWGGKVSVHRTDPASKNTFLQDLDVIEEEWEKRTRTSRCPAPKPETKNAPAVSAEPPTQKVYHLEESVEVWSDFLRLRLHPRSVSLINDHTSDGDVDRFDVFGLGDSLLLRSPPVADDLEDRLHFFTEECDSLQGFQLLCDLHDGFSGLGARAVERLRDEYGAKSVLVWGLVPPAPPALSPLRSVYRLVNYALGMARLADTASVLLPLSVSSVLSRRPSPPVVFPNLHYNAELHYHSSAVLAAAVGTSSLPYRTHSRLASLSEFADSLSGGGRGDDVAGAAVPAARRRDPPRRPAGAGRRSALALAHAGHGAAGGLGLGARAVLLRPVRGAAWGARRAAHRRLAAREHKGLAAVQVLHGARRDVRVPARAVPPRAQRCAAAAGSDERRRSVPRHLRSDCGQERLPHRHQEEEGGSRGELPRAHRHAVGDRAAHVAAGAVPGVVPRGRAPPAGAAGGRHGARRAARGAARPPLARRRLPLGVRPRAEQQRRRRQLRTAAPAAAAAGSADSFVRWNSSHPLCT